MKKILFFILASISFTVAANESAQSGTIYTSNHFYAPCNSSGQQCSFSFEVEMVIYKNHISGKIITMHGVRACRWDNTPITGKINPDGTLQWRSEKHAMQGCGSLIFKGQKDGNNLIGSFPRFQGVEVPITLTPKK